MKREIDSTIETVAHLVGDSKRVLLLGSLGEVALLLRERDCQVIAAMLDWQSPADDGDLYEQVISIEAGETGQVLDRVRGRFDVIVAGRFFEYLNDPAAMLLSMKQSLPPDGYIVAEIENATSAGRRIALLSNGGAPRNGHDSHPARYFSWENVEELFRSAELLIGHVEREESPESGELQFDRSSISPAIVDALLQETEARTDRFIVVAYPASGTVLGSIQRRLHTLSAERAALRHELDSLRQAVEAQNTLIKELETRAASSPAEQQGLTERLTDAYRKLESNQQDLHRVLLELQAPRGAGASTRSDYYGQIVPRMRGVVNALLPVGCTVAVVSKGDDELLSLGDRRAWHFPQTEQGVYAGHYPADDAEAIDQLETVRARGAQYLLFPATSLWWLDHYAGLREHLDSRYSLVIRQEDTCAIYAL